MLRILWTLAMTTGFLAFPVAAAAPSGADTFQLLAAPSTGADNTGDGGSGSTEDLNYYYVGQSFDTTIEIKSGGTDAANIWIDYDTDVSTASGLTDGTYFPSYSGQTITGGRVKLTGFRTSGTSSGTGTFGSLTWTADEPTEAAYATGSPGTLDVNVGTIGASTESNIALGGADLLDDEEDFQFHVWADTVAPYAANPSPAHLAAGVSVSSNYTFDLRDSLNGEGDDAGSGTGVDTATPPGAITADDGGGPTSMTGVDSYACSGTWGTELCTATLNPAPPSGIPGDTRNWEYATTYDIDVSGFRDLASASQDQLGDANGPNAMSPKTYSFTTETDSVPPQVVSETPVRASSGNAVGTNVTVVVHDKKTYPGTVSGSGVDSATCSINVSSPSFALATFQQGDAEVAVSAVDYGFQFVINPTSDFAQDETVTVSAFDCEDVEGNLMVTDTWTFGTVDSDSPYVDGQVPDDDDEVAVDTSVVLHVKDDGSGVDIGSVVVFVDGAFWTDGGGAGSVTTSGTDISFAGSSDFNGGNYLGDTTSVSGSADDYTVTIDPAADFSSGEAVPVIVWAEDASGNLMPETVYAFVIESPGGGGGGGGGSNTPILPGRAVEDIEVTQVDEDSVLVAWRTTVDATGYVAYGDISPPYFGTAPLYGYSSSTTSDGIYRTYHSVIVDGLQHGTTYAFMPVNADRTGAVFVGEEVRLAPKPPVVFQCPQPSPAPACPSVPEPVIPVCPSQFPTPSSQPPIYVPMPEPVRRPEAPISKPTASGTGTVALPPSDLRIGDIRRTAEGITVGGRAHPNETVIVIIR